MSTNNMPGKQLAAKLAHEIRNPLALIKANLQYIELSDKKNKYKKNYDIIHREIDRIHTMLQDYMETGTQGRIYPRKFKIGLLINEVSQIFARPLMLSNISLDIIIDDGDFELCADYDKMKQVLINLVQNAKESIEQKGRNGLIQIHAAKREHFIDIIVSDNGTGMSDEELKMAGTPFFTKKDRGCGLGVSISKEIIEGHKGNFAITGEKNEGARVTITIPSGLES